MRQWLIAFSLGVFCSGLATAGIPGISSWLIAFGFSGGLMAILLVKE